MTNSYFKPGLTYLEAFWAAFNSNSSQLPFPSPSSIHIHLYIWALLSRSVLTLEREKIASIPFIFLPSFLIALTPTKRAGKLQVTWRLSIGRRSVTFILRPRGPPSVPGHGSKTQTAAKPEDTRARIHGIGASTCTTWRTIILLLPPSLSLTFPSVNTLRSP